MAISVRALVAALSLFSGAHAARSCATPAYDWRILDLRFDGADPTKDSGLAVAAVSVMPDPRGSFFECVGQWPESWEGWYQGGSNIIWSDCIWSGAAPTNDKTVSMALDWKNQTLYLTHTFACSDQPGTDGLATGSLLLDMNCTSTADATTRCIPANDTERPSQSTLTITTTQTPKPLNSTAACTENSKRYQSWQLEKWTRQYDMAPASWSPGTTVAPADDSGPSFNLKSMANEDAFNCKPSGRQSDTFNGSCTTTAGGNSTTSMKFSFDPKLDMLALTQHWSCSGSTFDAVGIGYVQATCDRNGNTLSCSSDPVWIGTKTV